MAGWDDVVNEIRSTKSDYDIVSVNAGRILTTTAGRKLTAFSRSGIDHPV